MTTVSFSKYHGAGNDFILILDLTDTIRPLLTTESIAKWCERRYGIGADGLMLVQKSDSADFKMVYYNSDGRESSMCGNGGRCIALFAHKKGLSGVTMSFEAIDGIHHAAIKDNLVELGMQDISPPERYGNGWVLDTGSPHYVEFMNDFPDQFIDSAHTIRYDARFKEEGINVNYVVFADGELHIRTYERGVENETHACGTGVTAAAIVYLHDRQEDEGIVHVKALGGKLSVSTERKNDGHFRNTVLTGPAVPVYSGELFLD